LVVRHFFLITFELPSLHRRLNPSCTAHSRERTAFDKDFTASDAGLYPGRVVEIADERSIVGNRVSQPIIRQMLEQGMRELTGEQSVREAWEKFIEPQDIVGSRLIRRALRLLLIAGDCA